MSTPNYLFRASEDAIAEPTEERRIDVRLVKWGEVASQTNEGIRECFARGAFANVDPAGVIVESQRHDGSIVGVAESIEEREDGAYARLRVSATAAGDELLALVKDKVLRNASVVFASRKHRDLPGGVVERQSVDLARVAILPRGAYPSAQVLAVRGATTEEVVNEAVATVDLSPVTAAIAAVEGRLAVIETQGAAGAHNEPDIFRFRSLAEYTKAAYEGPSAYNSIGSGDMLSRAAADQLTTQNAGLFQPAWLTDVKRIVNLGRRAINAFGGPGPLPSTGMVVDWPFLTSANTLIAVQSTQKAEVQTQRVDIDKGESAVVTYAGGSDISYQLLQRSSPSYREAYDRIMLAAWAKVTDAAFVAALEAGASGAQVASGLLGAPVALALSAHADDIFDTAADHGFTAGDRVIFTALTGGDAATAALVGRVVFVISTSLGARTFRVSLTPGGAAFVYGTADLSAGSVTKVTDTGSNIRTSLFEASAAVEDATGSPAGIVLASTDVFLALAAMTGIVSPIPAGNPTNADGTALASTLRMDISGLEVVRATGVSAGKAIVSNRLAAQWLEDGPKWVTAEDVMHLGTDVAVYSFAAPAIYIPAGIIEVTLI